jgi:hypothetical protein
MVGVESEIASPAPGTESSSPGSHGPVPPVASQSRRLWWLVSVLAVGAAFILGLSIEHAADHRTAARGLYRMQVLTTVSRFLDEEHRQIAIPVAQRSAPVFGDLADSISGDLGVNGSGTLQVSLGAGSAAPSTQIAFSATVSSPYASTTLAVWDVRDTSHGGVAETQGACVLSSTLLGRGRARAALDLGGGEELQPCSPQWWSAGSAGVLQPRLGRAGVPRSAG